MALNLLAFISQIELTLMITNNLDLKCSIRYVKFSSPLHLTLQLEWIVSGLAQDDPRRLITKRHVTTNLLKWVSYHSKNLP